MCKVVSSVDEISALVSCSWVLAGWVTPSHKSMLSSAADSRVGSIPAAIPSMMDKRVLI